MKVNSLQELYVDELKDLYDAENQIIKALPKMIDAASSEELQNALTEHWKSRASRPNVLSRSSRTWEKNSKPRNARGWKV